MGTYGKCRRGNFKIVKRGLRFINTDPNSLYNSALAAFKAKRHAEAQTLIKELLALDPNHAGAGVLLANLAFVSGDPAKAESYLREAVRLDPTNLEALIGLASLLANGGNPGEAVELCDRAIEQHPNLGAAHFHKGRALIADKRPSEAIVSLQTALNLMPKSAPAQHWVGVALQMTGSQKESAAAFQQAIDLDPNFGAAYGALGNLLLSAGDTERGVALLRKAAGLMPNSPEGHLYLAKALTEKNKPFEAIQLLEQLTAAPYEVEALVLLIRIWMQLGDFDKANGYLARALQLDPERTELYSLLVMRKPTEGDRANVDQMVKLATKALPEDESIQLNFSLGKAFEAYAEYEGAFAYFKEGNRLAKQRLIRNGKAFNQTVRNSTIEATITGFDTKQLEHWRAIGVESEKPIFIVGMPRSGTTLLEQVISSHPAIGAVGELGTWKALSNPAFLKGKRVPAKSEANAIAAEFLKNLTPTQRFVIEKTPQNYLIAGPILGLFPNAHIIHCKRDPIDTCLSIHTTLFLNGPEYAHDLEELAAVYKSYERLMAHWRSILPTGRFIEVQYEVFVSDREPILRQIFEFLGLEWSDKCLSHEGNAHPISTPSVWQARQPVNKGSVGRWRNYEQWLGPLLELERTDS